MGGGNMLFQHEKPDAMFVFKSELIKFSEGRYETDDKEKIEFLKSLPSVTVAKKTKDD